MILEVTSVLADYTAASGSTRALWIVVPPLIAVTWGWIVWRLAAGTDESTRLGLFLVFAVAVGVGAAIFLIPHGFSGNGDYLLRFWISLAAAAFLGALASVLEPRIGIGRAIATAIAGDVFLPVGAVLLFVWALSVGGNCLD